MKISTTPETKVRITSEEVLSRTWPTLKRYTYDYFLPDGREESHIRESYDRGNGTTALLYNPEKKTVILVRQFRLPTFLNGNASGDLIETCAGKLGKEDPDQGILREIEEETGHRVSEITKVFEAYMSPGSVTELIHFYMARYSENTKISDGGGLASEQENIEVLELPFERALELMEKGEIKDAKTIMLLQYARLRGIL